MEYGVGSIGAVGDMVIIRAAPAPYSPGPRLRSRSGTPAEGCRKLAVRSGRGYDAIEWVFRMHPPRQSGGNRVAVSTVDSQRCGTAAELRRLPADERNAILAAFGDLDATLRRTCWFAPSRQSTSCRPCPHCNSSARESFPCNRRTPKSRRPEQLHRHSPNLLVEQPSAGVARFVHDVKNGVSVDAGESFDGSDRHTFQEQPKDHYSLIVGEFARRSTGRVVSSVKVSSCTRRRGGAGSRCGSCRTFASLAGNWDKNWRAAF